VGRSAAMNAPSDWVRRWSHLLRPQATVLDVACGSGRHVRWLTDRGCRVTGVDRDAASLAELPEEAEAVAADIEQGPWPLTGRRFDAVVMTCYLWRPLMPTLLASLNEGGLLLCETFAHGNATMGRPSNPHFLLQPGELLRWTAGLRVIAFEDGFLATPDRFVQRITAIREGPPGPVPARYAL
jgi:SAM-dependent methyltransferase